MVPKFVFSTAVDPGATVVSSLLVIVNDCRLVVLKRKFKMKLKVNRKNLDDNDKYYRLCEYRCVEQNKEIIMDEYSTSIRIVRRG